MRNSDADGFGSEIDIFIAPKMPKFCSYLGSVKTFKTFGRVFAVSGFRSADSKEITSGVRQDSSRSKIQSRTLGKRRLGEQAQKAAGCALSLDARVTKLVDVADLKSAAFGRTGSIPVPGTTMCSKIL